jgi:hypothetical protein
MAAISALGILAALAARPGVAAAFCVRPVAPGAASWAAIFASTPLDLALSAALATLALGACLARVVRGPAPAQAWVVAGAAIAELALVHSGINPTVARDFFRRRPEILGDLHAAARPRLYVFDYRLRAAGHEHAATKGMLGLLSRVPTNWPRPFAEAVSFQAYLYPPIGGRWGLRGSYDNDLLGLYPKDLFDMVVAFRGAEESPAFLRLLQLGGVEDVIALHTEGLDGVLEPVPTTRGYFPRPIRLYRVPDPLPVAYAVGTARAAEGPAAFRTLVDPDFDPRREVVLPQADTAPAPGFAGRAAMVEQRADRLVLETDLNAPGYVVVLDSYDPGWKATVDATPATVLPANLIFRAVAVPAGRHRVEMVYRPRALLLGLAVSGASLLFGLAWLVRARVPR